MKASIATSSSSPSMKVGAILITLLLGSIPFGKVAPAGVIITPISEHKAITSVAIGFFVV